MVASTVGNNSYDLASEGECHQYEGWRYLFAVYSRAPERSDIDSTFGWLYPNEIHDTPVDYSVVVTGHDTGKLGFSYKIIDH